jgi:hypothetical protein
MVIFPPFYPINLPLKHLIQIPMKASMTERPKEALEDSGLPLTEMCVCLLLTEGQASLEAMGFRKSWYPKSSKSWMTMTWYRLTHGFGTYDILQYVII